MSKKIFMNELSLNSLALFLHGEKALTDFSADEQKVLGQIEDGAELVFENREYMLPRTLYINRPLKLTGNGAHLAGGAETRIGIIISSSNVTVSDFKITKVPFPVEVDSFGKICEHVTVEKITAENMEVGIQVASSESNGILRDIHVKECVWICKEAELWADDTWEESGMSVNVPIVLHAATGRNDTKEVNNCLLEDIYVEDNKCVGTYRIAIDVSCAMASEYKLTDNHATYDNNTIKNVHLLRNSADCCWDSPFNILCNGMDCSNSHMENIEVAENNCGFGISGLYLFACEGVWSSSDGCSINNVTIRDNHFKRAVDDVGEPSRGLFLAAGRADYFENLAMTNGTIENVDIYGNTIEGAGIVVAGAYSLLDGDLLLENNVVRNIRIHDNTILNADNAFKFTGAEMEGRRYDWNFGFPRHDQKWLDAVEDDNCITIRMKNNRIENLTCINNKIEGYRYRVVAVGAECRGHGEAYGNTVTKDIIFRDNHYGVGENHVRVADYTYDDFSHDAGGNSVTRDFLKK